MRKSLAGTQDVTALDPKSKKGKGFFRRGFNVVKGVVDMGKKAREEEEARAKAEDDATAREEKDAHEGAEDDAKDREEYEEEEARAKPEDDAKDREEEARAEADRAAEIIQRQAKMLTNSSSSPQTDELMD